MNVIKGIDLKKYKGQYRTQRIPTNVPNPTTADSLVEFSVELDRDFNKIVAVGFFEISAGGVADNYRVGFRTSRKVWIDPINVNAWDANANVGPEEKYYQNEIGYGQGDKAYCQIVPNANTSAAMLGEMVVIVARDLEEVPRS